MLDDCAGRRVRFDFTHHARALGCTVEDVAAHADVEELRAAYHRACHAATAKLRQLRWLNPAPSNAP